MTTRRARWRAPRRAVGVGIGVFFVFYAAFNEDAWVPLSETIGNGSHPSFGPSGPALAACGADTAIT